MANSQITVRVPDGVKELWKAMADRDGRSMTNYLERLLLREQDRFENGEVTLERLDKKLELILNSISESKKKPSSAKKDKTAYDAWELVDGEEICTRENWNKWITHLHKLGVHLTHYAGELHFDKLKDIWYADKDCDLIINHIIKQGHKTLYIPQIK